MKLYHKIGKIAISVLCFFMALIMFVKPASAASSFYALNEYLNSNAYVSLNGTTTEAVSPDFEDGNNQYIVTHHYSCNSFINGTYNQTENRRYLYGFINYRVTCSFDVPLTGFSVDSVELSCNDNQVTILRAATRTQNSVTFFLSTVLTDFWYEPRSGNMFGNANISFSISYLTNYEYGVDSMDKFASTSSSVTADSDSIRLDFSIMPNVYNGLGGVIQRAVTVAMENEVVDILNDIFTMESYNNTSLNNVYNQLVSNNSWNNTINSNINSIASLLGSIKTQDIDIFNGILSKIQDQIDNDTSLYNNMVSYLNSALYGSNTYLTPSGSWSASGDVGDLLAQLAALCYGFHFDFREFVNSNQSEAAAVNSEASSQVSALTDLESQLSIPSANADSAFEVIDSALPDIADGSAKPFYWLSNNYFVTIISMCVSLGLVGFILYGKG